MPVKETKPTRYGWNMVSFKRTPVMSSYLLAWAVGDFGYIEACTDRQHNGKYIPVRVYTTSGLEEQGRLALTYAIRTISLFSELFKIDYPLPKADLIAVHETTAAVEHWGLISFYTNQLLFENETSDFRSKSDIAYVVAHELAHQWFGNLVTMDWWDDLWLNEGFATWVGWYAVHCLHPEWEIWVQFVTEHMEKAFLLDGLRASHPIHIPIRDALETDQFFDDISYSKGCAVIRMFADHLGVDTFLSGISLYLEAHAYGNADTRRLWEVLSEVSGQDMSTIVYSWIHKAGYPVLTVTEESSQISVKQSRFLSTGDMRPEDDNTIWWLPLSIEGKKAEAGTVHILYNTKDQVIDVDESFYKLNTGATGFYRVNYPASRLVKFTQQLDRLDTQERIYIISSVASLAFGGYHNTAVLLTLLQGFFKESHPLVWRQVFSTIRSIKSVFSEDMTIRKGLKNFVLQLIDEKVRMIDWDFPENEDHLNASLRVQLIEHAVANDHPE
jgi:aminopeptidase N